MSAIIPTRFKSKLPQRLSFPIGAETLSEALSSVPQFKKLTVTFFYYAKANDFPKESVKFSVIEVKFRNLKPDQNSSKDFIEQGFYEETWEITVKPVPRELKFKIKQHLVAEGLPKIKDWLSMERPESWLEGRKNLEVIYHKTGDLLSYKESGTR
jgi:hypothetical protein